MIGEWALVRTVDVQLDEAVWSITQHECSPTPYSHPILQFVGHFDLGDPDIVLVPLRADSVRSLTYRRKEVRKQLAHRGRPLGAATVYRQHLAIGRHQCDRRLPVEHVDGSE
jgi:hypothetical protein